MTIVASNEEAFVLEMLPQVALMDEAEVLWGALEAVEADLLRYRSEQADLLLEYEHLRQGQRLRASAAVGPIEQIHDSGVQAIEPDILGIRALAKETSLDLTRLLWEPHLDEPAPSQPNPAEIRAASLRAVWRAARKDLLALRTMVWRLRQRIEVIRFGVDYGPAEVEAIGVADRLGFVGHVWWSRPRRALVAIVWGTPDHDPLNGKELLPETVTGWQVLQVSADDFRRLREGELEVPEEFGVNWERVG